MKLKVQILFYFKDLIKNIDNFLLLALCLSSIYSCAGDEEQNSYEDYTLNNKEKSARRAGTIGEWVNKLNNVQELTFINAKTSSLVEKLKGLIENYSRANNGKILNLGIELSKQMNEEDFEAMFCTLKPYYLSKVSRNISYRAKFSTARYAEERLKMAKKAFEEERLKKEERKKNIVSRSNLPRCDCNWTCGYWSHFYSIRRDCIKTETGCGFLQMYECTGYVDVFGLRPIEHEGEEKEIIDIDTLKLKWHE